FQLYTVPGQVYYNATRKLVLRGADGVIFVADSQPDRQEENLHSLRNLQENLLEHGFDMRDMPLAMQYNKQDLEGAVPAPRMNTALNFRDVPSHPASALTGAGVVATLRSVSEMVLRSVSAQFARTPS
ncbi:MAG TPA: ADP-ribosylation factor-like protein, partial [Longimicrobiales bacterium]|nr:ADP-ribosylation factor-like protein [Longimicrobiales bacterium]